MENYTENNLFSFFDEFFLRVLLFFWKIDIRHYYVIFPLFYCSVVILKVRAVAALLETFQTYRAQFFLRFDSHCFILFFSIQSEKDQKEK